MISAFNALDSLREGNRRFIMGKRSDNSLTDRVRRHALLAGQEPFAIILGCSDSRVPVEIIFDQGLGDLFVIRVAGNVALPPQVGSIEFAAEYFNTKLVVVLGHSNCGAVEAAIGDLKSPNHNLSQNLREIVDRIRPSVEPLIGSEFQPDPNTLMGQAVRANIRNVVNLLRQESPLLAQRVQSHGLLILGAEYSLETGVVDFFEGDRDEI